MIRPVAGDLHVWPGNIEHPEIVGYGDISITVYIDGRVIIAPERIQTRIRRTERTDVARIADCIDADKIVIIQEVIPDFWQDCP